MAAAGADAAAEAPYSPSSAILLQNYMKNTWNYKPCQFSVHHKTAYKSAEIMPNLDGWLACWPAAAGADGAAAEALYGPCSTILLQNCSKNTWNYKPCQFSSVQCSPRDSL